MGSSTQKTTTTSGPTNPDVNSLVSNLSKGLNNLYTPGQNLVTGPGATTQGGWASSLAAANNPAFNSGISGAIGDFADVAAGNRFGTNDPGFAALRQRTIDDTLNSVNKSFSNANLFGSDANVRAASEGVGNAIAGLDYGNYQQDIARQQQASAILPQLFSAGQLPSSIQQSVGASQDAATQAGAKGKLSTLADYIAAAQGTYGGAGTTSTTSTPTTPLWQTLLGLGVSFL